MKRIRDGPLLVSCRSTLKRRRRVRFPPLIKGFRFGFLSQRGWELMNLLSCWYLVYSEPKEGKRLLWYDFIWVRSNQVHNVQYTLDKVLGISFFFWQEVKSGQTKQSGTFSFLVAQRQVFVWFSYRRASPILGAIIGAGLYFPWLTWIALRFVWLPLAVLMCREGRKWEEREMIILVQEREKKKVNLTSDEPIWKRQLREREMTSESNERRRPIDWTRNDDDCYYYESHVANAVGRYLSTVNHHQPKEKMTEEGAKPRKSGSLHNSSFFCPDQVSLASAQTKLPEQQYEWLNKTLSLSLSICHGRSSVLYTRRYIYLYVEVIW